VKIDVTAEELLEIIAKNFKVDVEVDQVSVNIKIGDFREGTLFITAKDIFVSKDLEEYLTKKS